MIDAFSNLERSELRMESSLAFNELSRMNTLAELLVTT